MVNERWYRLDRKGSFNDTNPISVSFLWLPEHEAVQYAKYPDLYTIKPVVIMTQDEYEAERAAPQATPAVMPTPDWANAPAWANYWAMDENGAAYWYELHPKLEDEAWNNVQGSKWELASKHVSGWQTLKQRRPQHDQT